MNLHCLNQIVYTLLIQLLQSISKGNTYIFCFSSERSESLLSENICSNTIKIKISIRTHISLAISIGQLCLFYTYPRIKCILLSLQGNEFHRAITEIFYFLIKETSLINDSIKQKETICKYLLFKVNKIDSTYKTITLLIC